MAKRDYIGEAKQLGMEAEAAAEKLFRIGQLSNSPEARAGIYAELICDHLPELERLLEKSLAVFQLLPAKAPPPHDPYLEQIGLWWPAHETPPCACLTIAETLRRLATDFSQASGTDTADLEPSNRTEIRERFQAMLDADSPPDWLPPSGESAYIDLHLVQHEWRSVVANLEHFGGKLPSKPKRPKRTDADKTQDQMAVLAYVLEHPDCKRDEVAEALGISGGHVSATPAWKQFELARKARRKARRAANRAAGSDTLDQMADPDDSRH